jgi:hypothetical protein
MAQLSAKAQEEVEYLELVLRNCAHLNALVEQYAGAKNKNASDMYTQQITRTLTQMRQNAMAKNRGFIADAAGTLGVAAVRGSQLQRCRTLREGVVSLRQLVERTSKATVDADHRLKAEKEKDAAAAKDAAAQAKATGGAD